MLFSLFLFGLFSMPIWMGSWFIGMDLNVKFWFNSWVRYGLLLPVFYVVTHVYHLWTRTPSRIMCWCSVLGSMVFCFAAGAWSCEVANLASNKLGDGHCESWPRKLELEDDWQAAQSFFAVCLSATAARLDMSVVQAAELYRINGCAGYEDMAKKYPTWEYLEELEKEEECSGWCFHTRPLWTHEETQDGCASTVADLFHNKIERAGTQILIYMVSVTLLLGWLACTIPEAVEDNLWAYW